MYYVNVPSTFWNEVVSPRSCIFGPFDTWPHYSRYTWKTSVPGVTRESKAYLKMLQDREDFITFSSWKGE